MIQQILFYGIGLFLIYLLYRIVKVNMTTKDKCSSCSGNCEFCGNISKEENGKKRKKRSLF